MRDVTDRKIQEQALELARTEAEQADAAKSRFLATMSHELRTPLNAIIGFSEMIVQEDVLMLDAARRKEYAQLINDSGQHLLSVVNGILDMSKMETGNFEIAPEPFAPRAALINCCNLLALEGARKRHRSRHPRRRGFAGHDRRPARVQADPAQPGVQRDQVHRTRRHGDGFGRCVEGARLVLRSADTGVGIAADDLKRIGDPFFQAGKTYQRRHEGTGLGLSIVKSLVGLHGGEMTVQSKLDEGTTVTVALPLAFTPPRAAVEQCRNADAGAAIGTARSNPSGEEKCLDELPMMMTMPRRRRGAKAVAIEAIATAERGNVAARPAAQSEGHRGCRAGHCCGRRHRHQCIVPAVRTASVADVRLGRDAAGARRTPASPLPRPRPTDSDAVRCESGQSEACGPKAG